MKITVIHGQNHRGCSYHIAHLLFQEFEGTPIDEIWLPHDLPQFCIGCYRCMKQGMQHCPHADDVSRIAKSIAACDLLIFTTPVYCMRTSGAMKSMLDHFFVYWLIHRPLTSNFHKKAIIISTGAGAGTKKAIKDIKTSLQHWGLSDIWTLGITTQAMSWSDMSQARKELAKRKAHTIGNKIKYGEPHPLQVLKVRCLFTIMRLMQKKGQAASNLDHAYWKEQGWLEKKRPWHT